MKKSPWVLVLGLTINMAIIAVFYGSLNRFGEEVSDWLHFYLLYASIGSLCFALPAFILSAAMDPGYLKKKLDFTKLV